MSGPHGCTRGNEWRSECRAEKTADRQLAARTASNLKCPACSPPSCKPTMLHRTATSHLAHGGAVSAAAALALVLHARRTLARHRTSAANELVKGAAGG